jgi:hypothetical protein
MASIFGRMRRKNGTRKRKRIRTDRHGLAQADCAACLTGALSDNVPICGDLVHYQRVMERSGLVSENAYFCRYRAKYGFPRAIGKGGSD